MPLRRLSQEWVRRRLPCFGLLLVMAWSIQLERWIRGTAERDQPVASKHGIRALAASGVNLAGLSWDRLEQEPD